VSRFLVFLRRFDDVVLRYTGLQEAALLLVGIAMLAGGIFIDGDGRWVWLVAGVLIVSLIAFVGTPPMTAREAELRTVRVGEYWWLGVATPMGLGCWATFAYLAYRLRSLKLAGCAVAYFLGVVGAVTLNVAGHDTGTLSALAGGLYAATWVIGMVHAFAIRAEVRVGLDRLGSPGTVHPSPVQAPEPYAPMDSSRTAVVVTSFVAMLAVAFLSGLLGTSLPLFALPVIIFIDARWGLQASPREVWAVTVVVLICAIVLNLL
jgi:hypothetical protein